MSYCRWSTDDFTCELYIYEDAAGGWTIHVGSGRTDWHEGVLPEPTDDDDIAGWARRQTKVMELLKAGAGFDSSPIGLLHDGDTFNEPTPGECADRVEELIALGYRCPSEVVTELRAEQAVLDKPLRRSSVFDRPPGNIYEVPEGVIPEAMMDKFDD